MFFFIDIKQDILFNLQRKGLLWHAVKQAILQTNSNNIGNYDPFCLVLTINPDSVITGAPVEYTVTINGTAVPIWDKWGYPITSDVLNTTRKCYRGRYIESATPHVTLINVCSNHTASEVAAATTETAGS